MAGTASGSPFAGNDVDLHFTTPVDEPLSLALLAPDLLQWRQKDRRSPDVLRGAVIDAVASAQGRVNRSKPGIVVLAVSVLQPDFDQMVVDAIHAAFQTVGRRYRGVAAVAVVMPKVLPVGQTRSGRVRLCALPDPQSSLRRGESDSVWGRGRILEAGHMAVRRWSRIGPARRFGKRLGTPSRKREHQSEPEEPGCPRPSAQRTRPPAACGAVGTGCAGIGVVFSASAARASYSSAISAKIVCARSSVTCCANLRQRAACSSRNANPASTIGHQRHSIRLGANYTGRRLVGSLIQVKRCRGMRQPTVGCRPA